MSSKLNILVVDDSRTTRQLMVGLINGSADMRVAGEADNGEQAVQMAQQLRPDVVLMDIVMPRMDGLQATSEIMHTCPTPIVLITASLESYETDIAFKAMKAGALTVLKKPAMVSPDGEGAALLNTLRAMATVQVIHHWTRSVTQKPIIPSVSAMPKLNAKPEIVAIASSTGGPAALSEILRRLPAHFPLPVVIAQHIAPDFVPSLVEWLNSVTPLPVEIARAGEYPLPGHVYFAPGNTHLLMNKFHTFEFNHQKGEFQHIPSCDVLLDSVARSYQERAVGVILTGMGGDGALGLKAMYDAGAFTIAQDEETSIVFGMPQEAIKLKAVIHVLPILKIPEVLVNLMSL